MKTGLIIIITLLVGTVLASLLMQDPGYVMLSFRGYLVETSVPVILMILLGMYMLVRLVIHILRTPRALGRMAGQYRARREQRLLTSGLLEMAEGNWSRGERTLTRGVRQNENPLLNYLSAARAAQLQGAYERRDNWLRMAYEQSPDAGNAVLLTQAELQISHGQFEEARVTLSRLLEIAPEHAQGLGMLARLRRESGDWDGVMELLPKLRAQKVLPLAELDALAIGAYANALSKLERTPDAAALEAQWSGVPRNLRGNPVLLRAWAGALRKCRQSAQAEPVIRKKLNVSWDSELALEYSRLDVPDKMKHLARAEAWLTDHSDDPLLLLAVARLSMRNELWGKARSYLETSLGIKPSTEGYQLYGRLLEKLGESVNASEAFRAGLALATPLDNDLPALERPRRSR
jgi:HemY protein